MFVEMETHTSGRAETTSCRYGDVATCCSQHLNACLRGSCKRNLAWLVYRLQLAARVICESSQLVDSRRALGRREGCMHDFYLDLCFFTKRHFH